MKNSKVVFHLIRLIGFLLKCRIKSVKINDMKIELVNPIWFQVFRIPQGSRVVKGRHGVYGDLRSACRQIIDRFGCYSWQSNNEVHYCGSFAKDYARKEFKTNLEGRMHNYWQNHRIGKNGQMNTNKYVFDQIVTTIQKCTVDLNIVKFGSVMLENMEVCYSDYINNPVLVQAVEALLICHYRFAEQCTWNRT